MSRTLDPLTSGAWIQNEKRSQAAQISVQRSNNRFRTRQSIKLKQLNNLTKTILTQAKPRNPGVCEPKATRDRG